MLSGFINFIEDLGLNKKSLKTICFFQLGLFSLLFLSTWFLQWNLLDLCISFLWAQTYASFLFLSAGWIFNIQKKALSLSFFILKYPLLALLLWLALQKQKSPSFFIGLLTFLSFFIIVTVLKKDD